MEKQVWESTDMFNRMIAVVTCEILSKGQAETNETFG